MVKIERSADTSTQTEGDSRDRVVRPVTDILTQQIEGGREIAEVKDSVAILKTVKMVNSIKNS